MPLRQWQEIQAVPRSTELIPTLVEDGDDLLILDQTLLPAQPKQNRLTDATAVAEAIATMRVRGAPLIGATGAYGLAFALRADASDRALDQALESLAATRPTAVNLLWALRRVASVVRPLDPAARAARALAEARAIAVEDAVANAAIGRHGLALLREDRGIAAPLRLMTHCNAGRLATVAHGTALAPIYAAHSDGQPVSVWVSETRPRNQGYLTCWELAEAGVPHTLIADNAAGLVLMRHGIDAVIVGADRIAANGDVANKVGTYLKALAARAHGVPFYVAAPCSTIDFDCPDGRAIPIEERDGAEFGAAALALGSPMTNPAFDITPAYLVTAVISERGVLPPASLGQWRN